MSEATVEEVIARIKERHDEVDENGWDGPMPSRPVINGDVPRMRLARASSAHDDRAWLLAELTRLRAENEALASVVGDMLSGLQYLRETETVCYGFGIDRLEQTGRAALGQRNGGAG